MNHGTKIPSSLSQAFTTHHPNVFTLILSLSEGRAGIAWVPSYNMHFPPDINHPSLTPNVFFFVLLFCYPSRLSLSLSVSSGSKVKPQIHNRPAGADVLPAFLVTKVTPCTVGLLANGTRVCKSCKALLPIIKRFSLF
jgi:hypothetical protein